MKKEKKKCKITGLICTVIIIWWESVVKVQFHANTDDLSLSFEKVTNVNETCASSFIMSSIWSLMIHLSEIQLNEDDAAIKRRENDDDKNRRRRSITFAYEKTCKFIHQLPVYVWRKWWRRWSIVRKWINTSTVPLFCCCWSITLAITIITLVIIITIIKLLVV